MKSLKMMAAFTGQKKKRFIVMMHFIVFIHSINEDGMVRSSSVVIAFINWLDKWKQQKKAISIKVVINAKQRSMVKNGE